MKQTDAKDFEDKVQTSIRVSQRLLSEVQRAASMRGQTMNSVVTELLQDWSVSAGRMPYAPPVSAHEDPESAVVGEGLHQLKQYLRWFPGIALARELQGRIVLANGEYQKLVGQNSVASHLPSDDFDADTASLIMERHKAVRASKKPVLYTGKIRVGSESRKRLIHQFPIKNKSSEVQYIGTVELDLDQIRRTLLFNDPKKRGWQRAYRFAERPTLEIWEDQQVTLPDSLLRDFIECLGAVATVKELDGSLLCGNKAYFRVTGKHRADAIGRLPIENWTGPNQLFAEIIMYHDLLVRETKAPFIAVEPIPISSGKEDRLNLRFPIFDSKGKLEFTGQVGFEYSAVKDLLEGGEEESDAPAILGASEPNAGQ